MQRATNRPRSRNPREGHSDDAFAPNFVVEFDPAGRAYVQLGPLYAEDSDDALHAAAGWLNCLIAATVPNDWDDGDPGHLH